MRLAVTLLALLLAGCGTVGKVQVVQSAVPAPITPPIVRQCVRPHTGPMEVAKDPAAVEKAMNSARFEWLACWRALQAMVESIEVWKDAQEGP